MKPQEPRRHDQAADAVRQGRPVDAEYVRAGRKSPRILVLLVVSTLAAAILLLGFWFVSNGAFQAQNPTTGQQAADAPTDSTGRAQPAPTGEGPNVNAPTQPSN